MSAEDMKIKEITDKYVFRYNRGRTVPGELIRQCVVEAFAAGRGSVRLDRPARSGGWMLLLFIATVFGLLIGTFLHC
jgi:hypothetical protein